MKQGWQIKKLGEVCESRLGKTLNSTTDTGELRPYLCAVNVQWDRFDLSYVKEALFENDEIEKYTAKKGDLLVCEGGETGRAAIWDKDEPIQYQNALHRIRFEDNTIIPRFCLHYLHFLKLSGVLDKEYSHGATILHLVTKSLHSIPVPVPPLSEQQRIVALLDAEFAKIDALKANAEKNLQNAKDLFQAALKKELEPKEGWGTFTLGQVCDIARGGSPRPIKSFLTNDPNGIRWIKIGDTEVGGKYISSTKERIIKEGMKSSRYVKAGDFLLSNSMSFGRPYILKIDGCIHDGWLVIREYDKTFTQDFLYYLLLSPLVAKQFEDGARGSTVRNLNTDIVSAVKVSVPKDLSEQTRIVFNLDALNEKCKTLQANYEKTLSLCDDLKQALLRKAFNGEI